MFLNVQVRCVYLAKGPCQAKRPRLAGSPSRVGPWWCPEAGWKPLPRACPRCGSCAC